MTGAPVPAIEVVGPAKGRRRAGFAFGNEAVVIALDELTDEQVAAIEGDGELLSRRVEAASA